MLTAPATQLRSSNASLRHFRTKATSFFARPTYHPSTTLVTAATQQQNVEAATLSVWLPSRQVEGTVRLDVVPEGKGQVVVVGEVEPDSPAAEAGLVRGQKLVAISDPVRDSEVWQLGDRPSLRFVRDTLRLRRMGQVQLVLQDYLNVSDDPAWSQNAPLPAAALAATADTMSMVQSSNGAAGEPQQGTKGGDASASASLSSGASSDAEDSVGSSSQSLLDTLLSESDDERAPNGSNGSGMTIGEIMAAKYEAAQKADKQVTEVQKRIARRAEYMDRENQRDDTPLLLGLLLAFIGPAVIILGIAASTGYLDKLYTNSLTLN